MNSYENLESILLYPNESISLEVKTWLDLSNKYNQGVLMKAIVAMANNNGGGRILIGYNNKGQPEKDTNNLLNSCYTKDSIGEMIRRYISNVFFEYEVHIVKNSNSKKFPIIEIGEADVPVCCDKSGKEHLKYYIRKSTPPCSEEPKSYAEWNALITRCIFRKRQDLIDIFRKIMGDDFAANNFKCLFAESNNSKSDTLNAINK